MRRLWANILIAGACVFGACASVPSIIDSVSTNGDYKTQRQFTFQLTQTEKVNDGEEGKPLTETSAIEMAEVMKQRLELSEVSSYSISVSGNDLITLTYAADSEKEYQQIATYLCFSGSFALVNKNNDLVTGPQFLNGNAYKVDASVNTFPTVVIPVLTDNDDYTKLIEQARNNPETSTDEEGGETSSCPIYLIYNYVDGDTYETLNEQGKFEEKQLLSFDASNDETLYYNGSNVNGRAAFAQTCGYQDTNGNGVADPAEVSEAFKQATFLTNLINASKLDYTVKVIKGLDDSTKIWVEPTVEKIKNFNGIQFNATLISVIAAVVIVSLLLVVFFRLGALNILTTSLVGTLLTFLFITLTGLEYNGLCLIAYSVVALISITSGIIYCSKLKEEAYRGRTLKKANSEASKKSILPIVDLHVASLVVGILIFILGGQSIHSFASILSLGSLVSLVLSTLGLKALMWLATNTTKLTGKYEVFAIEKENVPNHMEEEKQRFFGAYADKDFSAKKKPASIIAICAFSLSLVGIIVSASLNNGNLFKQPTNVVTGSEIYITNTIRKVKDDSETSLNNDKIEAILKSILVYSEDEKSSIPSTPVHSEELDKKALFTYVTNIEDLTSFETTETKVEESLTNTYVTSYFQIGLKTNIDGDKLLAKVFNETIADDLTLNEVLDEYFDTYGTQYVTSIDVSKNVSLKNVVAIANTATPDWQKVTLSTSIAILILTVYFMLRYRLSRGLAMLVYPVVASTITLGLFLILSAVNMTMPTMIIVSMPVVTLVTYAFMILVANKERELLLEDKVRDNSIEHREETLKRAVGIAMTPVLLTFVIAMYLMVNFFGFAPNAYAFLFLSSLIGILVSLGLVSLTYAPLSNLLFKWFYNVRFNTKPRKSKKTNKVVKKSAEPEEAIFIGIND